MFSVYVENNEDLTEEMFLKEGWDIASIPENADLICFIGGADVSPVLYGEVNTHSMCNATRDLESVHLYMKAINNDIPCVGICRGGQFLNVMNGGKMLQDIAGHATHGLHKVTLYHRPIPEIEGVEFDATSTHHQGIVPNEDWDADLIGLSEDGIVEVLLYENDLCFQPHPEYSNGKDCRVVFFELIYDFLLGD